MGLGWEGTVGRMSHTAQGARAKALDCPKRRATADGEIGDARSVYERLALAGSDRRFQCGPVVLCAQCGSPSSDRELGPWSSTLTRARNRAATRACNTPSQPWESSGTGQIPQSRQSPADRCSHGVPLAPFISCSQYLLRPLDPSAAMGSRTPTRTSSRGRPGAHRSLAPLRATSHRDSEYKYAHPHAAQPDEEPHGRQPENLTMALGSCRPMDHVVRQSITKVASS